MLSEQLTPSAALHLGCSSVVAANLKAKDETRCISLNNNNINGHNCNNNNNNKIQKFKQIQRDHYECNNQKINKLTNSSVVGGKEATTTTTTTTTASVTGATTGKLLVNNSVAATTTQPISTLLPTPKAPTAPAAITTSPNATTSPSIATTTTVNTSISTHPKNDSLVAKSGRITAPPTHKVTNDASGRSAALERAYVHDVYENCEEPSGPIRPRVAQFLGNLDPGSVVCDVGCGSGRYLTQCNPAICTVGVDRCYRLSKLAREKGGEVALCDNLELPFRDESFDAVLSLAVVHHFATTERRVGALRELARILRIGGRVVITVWALEQRHRRFESQDVLIPWQPPKSRNFNFSDEEDADDFLPPYHAYTEDSTNSSRSAGDGDSSSLSSSSPGESCYSFVRRAIQKLAGGRRHPWFLDSWTSKDTKNDSSLDYEDARDLPIELRRLEDFEDFPDPPLSANLKSRSLGSILNPPPRQIVRSRSSVPSLGGPLLQADPGQKPPSHSSAKQLQTGQHLSVNAESNALATGTHSPTAAGSGPLNSAAGTATTRRPKLIKQKQSLCDEEHQLPENPFHVLSTYNSNNNSVNSSLYTRSSSYPHPQQSSRQAPHTSLFLRKQSSLNEELMAGNRIREKERVRKRIQKQTSLNEAFLCRSAGFSRRLQVIREGFSTKIKSSTGSLERVTKSGINKIIQNFKGIHSPASSEASDQANISTLHASAAPCHSPQQQHHHHHHHNPYPGPYSLPQMLHKPISLSSIIANKFNAAGVSYCNVPDCANAGSACYCSAYHSSSCNPAEDAQQNKPRRSSRESGSDSSKDSLQSDTSIESEDSFASVIFIPKPEQQHQQQQQLNYQQQHQNSNSSSSNSSSSNGGCANANNCRGNNAQQRCSHFSHGSQAQHSQPRLSSVPTSPLIMPCPPTPAHSPAATQAAVTSPPQTVAAVSAAMAILTPPTKELVPTSGGAKTHFNFDEADVKQQRREEEKKSPSNSNAKQNNVTKPVAAATKITRQTIQNLPPIPKFRKQQSLQLQRQSFPLVRRSSATAGTLASMSKLMSLELFNPATDDLDSDSSEPSSPDSIDSVISAPKLTSAESTVDEVPQSTESGAAGADEAASLDQIIKFQQEQYNKGELSISVTSAQGNNESTIATIPASHTQPPHCAAFAEQLSAQLQRELNDKNKHSDCRSLESVGEIGDYLEDGMSHRKRVNGSETRDMNAFREELRERRLMLANLSTQPSLQQSPTSSSTSSLSSQTRSFTIHEEDEEDEECEEENERSYMLQLYENCKISKFSYERNRQYNLNAETAYLLQDDGDSSARDDDEFDDMEHDVIPEEDEEDEAAAEGDGGDQLGDGCKDYSCKNSRNTIKCDDDSIDEDRSSQCPGAAAADTEQPPLLQNRTSTESWERSNSSNTSLDSPSQGGATTHHRYYHVFREGELDALINHHVASLHIVSSYYERASWCVVAEKVQVWTI